MLKNENKNKQPEIASSVMVASSQYDPNRKYSLTESCNLMILNINSKILKITCYMDFGGKKLSTVNLEKLKAYLRKYKVILKFR